MVGKLLPDAGIARYAGISPSRTGIFTSPAARPSLDVVIVCADTGSTAAANPAPSVVTMKSRRPTGRGSPNRLRNSGCIDSGCTIAMLLLLLEPTRRVSASCRPARRSRVRGRRESADGHAVYKRVPDAPRNFDTEE